MEERKKGSNSYKITSEAQINRRISSAYGEEIMERMDLHNVSFRLVIVGRNKSIN